jgi:type II secretory pathway pseudopilin PulG
MVVRRAERSLRREGSLLIELLVAMAILTGILLPIAYSVASERRFARAAYQRAVAMEIVDGEMEALAAGGWRAFTNGVTDYAIDARAATNLPPGRFILTMTTEKVRLEWHPNVKQHGGAVVREVRRR